MNAGVDFERLSLMTLYRASDALMKHRDVIERTLFNRVHDPFGLETTVTLYDLTNTYFEGTAAANPKANYGRSKEKRSDCPLVTLGLVLDGSGFVRRSETFEAETAIPIETAAGATVRIQRVDDPDNQEVRLYCHSEQREQKERGINQQLCDRFEAGLRHIADGLSKPRTEKRQGKVHERIGRLKEKSKGIGQHYDIERLLDASGQKAAGLRWTKQPQAGTRLTHPGVYCLRSSQCDWDSERLWRTYSMLTDLEAVFRSFKSELGLRPVYHPKEIRVDGHLFITVLAYQFVQIIRRQLQEHGIQGRWSRLRAILSVQQRVTASFRRADGVALPIRKATRPERNWQPSTKP